MLHSLFVLFEATIFTYTSFLAGDRILALVRVGSASALARRAYAILTGYAFFGIAGLALGLAGALTSFSLLALGIAVVAASSATIASHIRNLRSRLYPPARMAAACADVFGDYAALKIILALWLACNFIFAFAPITGHDTKDYHLPIITDMIRHGALNFSSPIPEYRWMPLSGEILYALPTIALGAGDGAPYAFQIIQYGALVLLLTIVWDFVRRRAGSKLSALVAVLGIMAITDFQREILHGGYIDVFVYVYGIASSLLIVDACADGDFAPRNLVLSALFAGFAMGIKETAGVIAIINIIFLGAGFLRWRPPPRRVWLALGVYALVAVAAGGFWYAKNAVVFGNPLYLGGKEFGETLIIRPTVVNFFLFPFYKFGQVSDKDSASRLVVLAYFAAYYALGAFVLAWRRRMISFADILLFAFVQTHLALVFFISHHTRYFLPAIILLPVCIAVLAARARVPAPPDGGARLRPLIRNGSLIAIHLAAMVLFIGNLRYFHVKFLYKTGVLTEAEYITQIGSQ